ncbi:hypothetical protein [Streptomyces sp. NBC_00198]|uniref:hypothetical protein n=1 Tax=Streptomyces sp. NBC_00198 TaxID=2975677 RepID=UPI0022515E22|nr:hypothetical protein [Streptomyces sp. NBC_00198]MCX5279969.1 hypothetical protein [Streptomyces sp. NBC_00198]
MTVEQLPGQVREFARYLNELMNRLDQGGGWCGVFWQRDPDGMRACLDGWEVPPWDVVEALLQDLLAGYGDRAATQETDRARTLHQASLAAHDARPGGRNALGDRLDVMLREQRYAAERQTDLARLLHTAATHEEADAIRLDLAWAHDDHERATARCTELRHRIDRLDRRAPHTAPRTAPDGTWTPHPDNRPHPAEQDTHPRDPAPGAPRPYADRYDPGAPTTPAPAHDPHAWVPAQGGPRNTPADPAHHDQQRQTPERHHDGTRTPDHHPQPTTAHTAFDPAAADHPAPPATKRPKRRTRGSARFAGMTEADTDPTPVPDTTPTLPTPTAPGRRTPRGARFAGAAEEPAPHPTPAATPPDDDARHHTTRTVTTLTRLRAEGRSGEAHALLVEAAHWPAARFPHLAAELHHHGLDADWATLLWEAASLPADRLVAAADALTAAGRTTDGQQMLRQGVARPAPEIGAAVLDLADQGRNRELRALLSAYVRVRTPEEAARSAQPDPQRLVPLLLEAARTVSDQRHWDLVHALRVAGLTT